MNAAAGAAQKTRIRVYKIVVLGDGGVGKSGMHRGCVIQNDSCTGRTKHRIGRIGCFRP